MSSNRRILRGLGGLPLLAALAIACSTLTGLSSLEKVDCVKGCAGDGVGGMGGTPVAGGAAGTSPIDAGAGAGAGGLEAVGQGGDSGAGATTPDPRLYLIDDFEDCDGKVVEFDGRAGTWVDFSNVLQTLTIGKPPSATWGDQRCGAFLTGQCQSCSWIGVGVNLTTGYDLTRFSGLRVTYETQSAVYIDVGASDGQTLAYAHSALIRPSAGETVATVFFDQMTRDATFPGFEHVINLVVRVADNSVGFGVGVHELRLLP